MPRLGPGGNRGSGSKAEIIPPGNYVIALVWFKRKQTERGSDYLSCLFEICGGQLMGKSFFSNMSLDLSKSGTVARWQVLMGVLGVGETIEMGASAEGTEQEGDANIRRLFKGRPFAVEVDVDRQGQYTNNGIKSVLFRSKWQKPWAEIAAEWTARQLSQASPDEYAGDPPSQEEGEENWDQRDPEEAYGPPARGGGNLEDEPDIPF